MARQVIKNDNFRKIAINVKLDAKRRIVLSRALVEEGVTYHVYCNDIGQIVLDPHVSIPASEAWLYKNREAFEALERGLAEAREGKITRVNIRNL